MANNAVDILNASIDTLSGNSSSCTINDANVELNRQKIITHTAKDRLVNSVEGAIAELNGILAELSSKTKLGADTTYINSMLYNSLLLLIDELDYIARYIERIENSIDLAVFDVAKKLNESIVHLIGHRKDILMKVIDTTYKIHDYIIKWKKIVNDTTKLEDDGDFTDQDFIERKRL
jgi:hypothetical protein